MDYFKDILLAPTQHGVRRKSHPSRPTSSPLNLLAIDGLRNVNMRSKKIRLTKAPVLVFADPQKPYVLHVDASLDELCGVSYQEHEEGLRPVAFIS